MLQNTKKINKIIAIAWAAALAAGIISAIYQGLANATETAQTSIALAAAVSSALSAVILLFIIIVIANIKHRRLLSFPLYQTVGLAAFAVTMPVATILSVLPFNGSSLTATLSAQLLMLSFIPYILFICQLTKQSNLPKIIFCALAAVNFLAQNIVGLTRIIPMTDLLRLSYVVIIICLLYTFYAVWQYRQNNTWYYNKLAMAIMLFAFCTLAEALTSSESKILLLLGFTLFTAVIYWLSQQNIIEALQAETADRIMHEHALIDYQTGFGSRLAFDEYYYHLDKVFSGNVHISIMVIDLNNLKDTNDKYGHQAGDELIKGAAACISEVFGDNARCFRTGGDEFAVVAVNSDIQMDHLMNKLDAEIIQYNMRNIRQLSIARGLCIDEAAADDLEKLRIIYKAADDRMYTDKIQKHEKLKVRMIQDNYLKKQRLQEQMIREKQFQQQMEKVAAAKMAEDLKNQPDAEKSDQQAKTDEPEPTAKPVENFHPLPRESFWGDEKTKASANPKTKATDDEIADDVIAETDNTADIESESPTEDTANDEDNDSIECGGENSK